MKDINSFIENALDIDYITSAPIEDFAPEQLIELSEIAKENNLLVTLRAEHSNLHQGILVSLVKKDVADKFIKYF